APSFADIFFNNCLQNGLLPVVLPEETVNALIAKAQSISGYKVTVDLEKLEVTDNQGFSAKFSLDEFRRHCLLNEPDITAYEQRGPVWKRVEAAVATA
ncbi:MAG: 3-isopropylmalate dehydratase small subunit, partial [Chloroflexi bacterium]|nr:3-isopropylmalate dehydratase small subunit [Chloroflexota bacterium]